MYLKDLKSTKALNIHWNPLVSGFNKNTATTHINNYIDKAFSKTGLNSKVVSVKNKYYNSLNDWDKLDFMQFLINYEYYKKYNSSPYAYSEEMSKLFNKFNKLEIATPSLVEDYAIKNRDGGISVFDDNYWNVLFKKSAGFEYGSSSSLLYINNMNRIHYLLLMNRLKEKHKRLKEEQLDELLGNVDSAEFIVSNLIRELGGISANQKDWLLNNIDEADKLIKFVGEHRHMGRFSPQESHLVFSFLNITEDIPTANFLKYKELYNSIEGFGISDENQIKWLYTNETEAKNLIKFADDNKVGGLIPLDINNFVLLAIEELTKGSKVNYYDRIIIDKKILDELPCHQYLIDDALSSCSGLVNAIQSEFGVSEKTNLIFRVSDRLPATTNGRTSPKSYYNSSDKTCNIFITLRKGYLKDATDISIARTLIHESLHAVLINMFERGLLLDQNNNPEPKFKDLIEAHIDAQLNIPTNLGLAHHEVMTNFVNLIANSLSEYGKIKGYSYPYSFYRKISWSGDMIGTSTFKSLYPKYINSNDATNNPLNINPEYLDIVNLGASERENSIYTFNHPNGNSYVHRPKGNILSENEPCN